MCNNLLLYCTTSRKLYEARQYLYEGYSFLRQALGPSFLTGGKVWGERLCWIKWFLKRLFCLFQIGRSAQQRLAAVHTVGTAFGGCKEVLCSKDKESNNESCAEPALASGSDLAGFGCGCSVIRR